MVGASAGPENFKTMHHSDLSLLQGKAVPFGQNSGLNSGIGNFIHERRDVNANTGFTGTLTRGSGFAEADMALDADFCGNVIMRLDRAAVTSADNAATYGAPYFRDNELYESIDKVQLRHEGRIVYEVTGADMIKIYESWPIEERAKWNAGLGAGMSIGERRIRASATCALFGPLILPWTMKNTLKEALPLRALMSAPTIRVYFKSLNSVVLGPSDATGGALSGLMFRQDNYHVEADAANAIALSVARGSYQVPYLEFIRQGAVNVTGVSSSVATTTTIQCPNFKRHAFAIECEIQHSQHLQDVIVDNVDRYCLPVTYLRVLSGSKQINVEEVYTPIARCVTSPIESLRYADNKQMYRESPSNRIRNIVSLCPPKTFDACMKGDFNNLRALQLYQDLQVQVVTPKELALYTKSGLHRGTHEYQEVGVSAITASSLTMTPIAYTANALRLERGKLQPLFSI